MTTINEGRLNEFFATAAALRERAIQLSDARLAALADVAEGLTEAIVRGDNDKVREYLSFAQQLMSATHEPESILGPMNENIRRLLRIGQNALLEPIAS